MLNWLSRELEGGFGLPKPSLDRPPLPLLLSLILPAPEPRNRLLKRIRHQRGNGHRAGETEEGVQILPRAVRFHPGRFVHGGWDVPVFQLHGKNLMPHVELEGNLGENAREAIAENKAQRARAEKERKHEQRNQYRQREAPRHLPQANVIVAVCAGLRLEQRNDRRHHRKEQRGEENLRPLVLLHAPLERRVYAGGHHAVGVHIQMRGQLVEI